MTRSPLILAAILLATQAPAHDAPTGWAYGFECCSTTDCRQVPDNWVQETAGGYVIRKTGELIPYSDKRIHDSPDGLTHWCSAGGRDDGRTLCIYRAPKGF